MKHKIFLLLGVIFSLAGRANNGDVFTFEHKGVTLTYRVLSEDEKTCQVGLRLSGQFGGDYLAIDQSLNTAVEIPETANGYTVTEIGKDAFSGSHITAFTIPTTIKKIGSAAFYNCDELTEVVIPESVEAIEYEAFAYCDNVQNTTIYISKNLKEIGFNPFRGWHHLVSVSVDPDNEFLVSPDGSNALIRISDNCLILGVDNTIIPSFVKEIGEYAFEGCNFKTIEIPESVEYIWSCAFSNCKQLESIVLPEGMKDMRSNMIFYGCSSLSSVEMPSGLTYIGYEIFYGCTSLTTISIPKNVRRIVPRAFMGCDNLKTVRSYIKDPENVSADNSESGLSGVTFPYRNNDSELIPETLYVPYGTKEKYANLKEWKDFKNIIEMDPSEDGLAVGDVLTAKTVEDVEMRFEITSVKAKTCRVAESNYESGWRSAVPDDYEGAITIPEEVDGFEVTAIGDRAFAGSRITSVVIPNSIVKLGTNSFYNTWRLKEIVVNYLNPFPIQSVPSEETDGVFSEETVEECILRVPANLKEVYKTTDGWKDFKTIFCGNEGIEFKFSTSEGVEMVFTVLDEYTKECMVGCIGGEDITTTIDMESVSGSVTIPEKVIYKDVEYTVSKIGNYAFSNAYIINSIVIPETVTEIGKYAFRGLFGMTISLPSSVIKIGDYAFVNSSGLILEVSFPTPIVISENVFENINKRNDKSFLRLLAGKKSDYASAVGWSEFGIDYMVVGNEGRSFTAQTIEGLEMVFTITDDEAKECKVGYLVGDYDHVAIDREKVEGIVTIPESPNGYKVVQIGSSAFRGVLEMTSINIPPTVTSIGERAFSDCGLESFELPSSVTEIANDFLEYNTRLVSLSVAEGNEKYDSRDGCNAIIEKSTNKLIIGTSKTVIPESVTAIGEGAFRGWKNLTMTIPETVTEIGDYAFFSISGLSLTVKWESPIEISDRVFDSMEYKVVKSFLRVPEGSKAVYLAATGWRQFGSEGIFEGNEGSTFTVMTEEGIEVVYTILDDKAKTCQIGYIDGSGNKNAVDRSMTSGSLTIPETAEGYKVVQVGRGAFENVQKLTSIHLPETITMIEGWAFHSTGLTSFELPASVKTLSDNVPFGGNSNLTKLTVNENNEVFDSRDGCNAIIEKETDKLIVGTVNTVIPSSVKEIGEYAFQNIRGVNIFIPATVSKMDKNAFTEITGAVITVERTIPLEIDKDVMWHINQWGSMSYLQVPKGSKEAYVNTPGWNNFGADYIVEVMMENETVFSPQDDETTTLLSCYDSSKEIIIASDVVVDGNKYTITAIGKGAFENKTTMEKVTIPETIEVIGANAFKGCTNLKEIHVNAKEPIPLGSVAGTRGSSASSVFAGVDMETCVLYVPAGSKKKYEQADGWKEFKNIKEMSSEMGDANDDGKISIADAVIMIDYILNRNPENFNATAADMNGDSQVTMTDVIQVLDKILKAQ